MKAIHGLAAGVLLAFLSIGLCAETPQKHIRVIMDTTASLHTNDPSGYVKLSTELFYDLAAKDFNTNDTFSVLHFPDAGDAAWSSAKTPPDTVNANANNVIFQQDHSDQSVAHFRLKVRGYHYTSQKTYFAPCFRWALGDLTKKGSARDNRVIVLITDGVSDAQSADALLLEKMVPELAAAHIHVFVLAFGQANPDWFTDALNIGPNGVPGKVFAGEDSRHLLSDMLEIFSRSFGYSREVIFRGPSQPLPSTIDVASGQKVGSAAVIALYDNKGMDDKPEFRLTPPGGYGAVGSAVQTEAANPDDKNNAKAVSYAMQWLSSPQTGSYGFDANGHTPAEIAVLRPIHVKIDFRSHQGRPIDEVIGGKAAPMDVVVSPADGSMGDPGHDLQIEYRLHYLQPHNETNSIWQPGKPGPPVTEGRVFTIEPQFLANVNGVEPGKPYQGYIEVVVRQFETEVERMTEPHPVTVYPYISVGVIPNRLPLLDANGGEAIEGGKSGCMNGIRFQFYAGDPKASKYALTARVLNPPDPSGAWTGARFSFDGKEFSGADAVSESVSPEELAKPVHSFCVIAGTPSGGDVGRPLLVHFGLTWDGLDAAQQRLSPVDDLETRATIAEPSLWLLLRPWLFLLVTALLTGLLALLFRARNGLPPDLEVAMAGSGQTDPASAARHKLSVREVLGLPSARPVLSLDGASEVGRVMPSRSGLFAFHPGSGFRNVSRPSAEEWGEWLPIRPDVDGSYLLEAGTTYRAGTSVVHYFRIEYSQTRSGI
ncbi:MAG: vWA domain-containing protein [Terracidiphilus sp.]